jgi:hypothetical protein
VLDKEDAQSLAAMLQVNVGLESLCLCKNTFGVEGTRVLVQSIGQNNRLRELFIYAVVQYTSAVADALIEALQHNYTLQVLDYEYSFARVDRDRIDTYWKNHDTVPWSCTRHVYFPYTCHIFLTSILLSVHRSSLNLSWLPQEVWFHHIFPHFYVRDFLWDE